MAAVSSLLGALPLDGMQDRHWEPNDRLKKVPQTRFKLDETLVAESMSSLTINESTEPHSIAGSLQLTTSENYRESKPFPFLDLPAEIRLQIYPLLLVSQHRVKITRIETIIGKKGETKLHEVRYSHDITNDDISPAILKTCRRCHQEGNSVLYGQNIWDFVINNWFEQFLHLIGPLNAGSIRCCFLRGYALDIKEWTLTIAPCMMLSRLKSFAVTMSGPDGRKRRKARDAVKDSKSDSVRTLNYLKKLIQVHPTLKGLIKTKPYTKSSHSLVLISEEYHLGKDVGPCRRCARDKMLTFYRSEGWTFRLR